MLSLYSSVWLREAEARVLDERERPFLPFVLAEALLLPRAVLGEGLRRREDLELGLDISCVKREAWGAG